MITTSSRITQVRPVIVYFTNRRVRDQAYVARKELRQGTHQPHAIYINEHLTKINEVIFSLSQAVEREENCWHLDLAWNYLCENAQQPHPENNLSR